MYDLKKSLNNVMKFSKGPELQTVIIDFLVKFLVTRADVDMLQQQFKYLDRDSDGVISLDEFTQVATEFELNAWL